jgi:ATP-binding cassette subfamily B protein
MSENRNRVNKRSGGGFGGGPMGSFAGPKVKAKDFKGTLKRLLNYLKPQRMNFILVFIFAIASTIFNIVGPKISGKAITRLVEGLVGKFTVMSQNAALLKAGKPGNIPVPGIDFQYIGDILLLLLGLYVISTLFGFLQQYIMAGVAQKTVYNLRKEVEDKISRLPLKFFDSRTHGEILSRVTNDVDNISTTLQQSLTQLITSIVTIVGVIIMMLTISPIMTLVVILTLPLYIVITTLVAKHSQKFFAAQQKEVGELNGHVEEMYTGHKIVKVFGHEKDSIKEFENINDRLYKAGWKAQFISGIIMPMMRFVSNIGYVIVCVVGGYLATLGKISIGDIQAFIQYSNQFTQPIVQTANIANIIQSTVASAERVFELLDEVEEIPDATDAKIIEFPKGEVKFDNVDFSYKTEEPLI